MKASIEEKFVPYITSFARFGVEETITIIFQLSNQTEQPQDDCGNQTWIKLCDNADLEAVTAARLEWQFCHKIYSLSDTDISEAFDVNLIQESGQTVAIEVIVHSNYVANANDFRLYGTVDNKSILLSRGRIYVSMSQPHPIDENIGGQEEWQTVEW